jgi:diguanylate cyclase (GGDEF)-like protein
MLTALGLPARPSFFASWQAWCRQTCSPFTGPVPGQIESGLVLLQAERLRAVLPLLCLTIAACALAMMVAVLGDLPWWQQFPPPAIIIGTCLLALAVARGRRADETVASATRLLRRAVPISMLLGLVSGVWAINAFSETEQYYCMVSPVFIGIGALVSATCLLSAPRAALAAIGATTLPIVVKMALYDNLGVRAMAAMLLLVAVMQAGVVLSKFRETVTMFGLQHELDELAQIDPLTGIHNRRAFMRALDDRLGRQVAVSVALIDLDRFKHINDSHGHAAGDVVLGTIAARLRLAASEAASVARLGGDEFALLFETAGHEGDWAAWVETLRVCAVQPIGFNGGMLDIGLSIGLADSPADGCDSATLLATADKRLYADKQDRRAQAHRRIPLRLAI